MVYLGADHGGWALKQAILEHLQTLHVPVVDCGNYVFDAGDDFPTYANAVVKGVLEAPANRGILVCGSGLGMSIAANHHAGIRAALVRDADYARLARQHNDANVLCLGGRFTEPTLANQLVDIFLTTAADQNPKYSRRMRMVDGRL